MFANIFTASGGVVDGLETGIEDAWQGGMPLVIALVGVGWGLYVLRKFGAFKRA